MRINLKASRSDINVIRSIYGAVIVLAPVFHWVLTGAEPGAVDSIPERLVAMGIATRLLLLSFWPLAFRKGIFEKF